MEEQIAKYLADEMGEEERKQFEEQLLSDEQLNNELQESIASWEIAGVKNQSTEEFNVDAAWNKVSEQLTIERELKPAPTRFSFYKIAASIMLIASLGYFITKWSGVLGNGDGDMVSFTTTASVEEVNLPDGSVIKLNANSSLTYDKAFGESNRNVILTGAANFDVARNENLPFVISTKNSEVKVLGTSFDVSAYDNADVEVNVSSGTVGFQSTKAKGEPVVLQAGEKATLSSDGLSMQRGKVKNQNYAAWWTRELVYENVKLSDVVKDFEKTYWVEIELTDAVAGCPITSTIKDKTLDEALEIVKATVPTITIDRDKENHIKLDGKGCTD